MAQGVIMANNSFVKAKMNVKDNQVSVIRVGDIDYISLTDLARYKNPKEPGEVVIKWMSNKSSFDFYCLWEELSNPDFKVAESRHFKIEAATQSFTMSPSRWIKLTNAKGFSIKEKLIPTLTDSQKKYVYASEADVINVALFGKTAKEWREENPELEGNIRDHANILQLIILSNLELLNASMIEEGISQAERLERLNSKAIAELNILINDKNIFGIDNLDTKLLN